MAILIDILVAIASLVTGTARALIGQRRGHYSNSIFIRAPREAVWRIATARSIEFDGLVPLKISSVERGDSIVDSNIDVAGEVLRLVYRVVEDRKDDTQLLELLKEGTDPKVRPGEDYFVGISVDDERDGTRLTMFHELTHTSFMPRVTIPLGLRQMSRRIRDRVEKDAGTTIKDRNRPISDAIITGAVTMASFAYLFGIEAAIILIVLLLIHELGHVFAMMWIGLPVKGIYFIPFMGAVAVGGETYRNEAERGLVALMGPGFSLISTAAFYFAYLQTGDPLWHKVALVSAILNGINLLPMLPLDGGHVTAALLSRANPEVARMLNMSFLIAGLGASIYMEWYILTAILLIAAPAVMKNVWQLPAMTGQETALLAIAALSTIAFYALIVYRLI